MSTISAKKSPIEQDIPLGSILRQACPEEGQKAQDERNVKETLLVSMKQKAAILRHLQEKDLVQGTDAREIKEILGDLDETIKKLETANV
jgi:hypothetical protein